jgi:hypothetical protein
MEKMAILNGYFTQESNVPELSVIVLGITPEELELLIRNRKQKDYELYTPRKMINFLKRNGYSIYENKNIVQYDTYNGVDIERSIKSID